MGNEGLLLLVLVAIFWAFHKFRDRDPGPAQERRGKGSRSTIATDLYKWPALDEYECEVVGESNYQKALQKAAASSECIAMLVPDSNNKYDNKAIAVYAGGGIVGYLSREDARAFRRRLEKQNRKNESTLCGAEITGGGTDRHGKKYLYGIRLDIEPFD